MNKLAALVVLAVAGAANAQTFSIAPVSATLAVQQDGTCRGHLVYAIALTDSAIADEAGIETGTIEIKDTCTRLTTLASGEVFDTKGGKLSIVVKGASVGVLSTDPDGAGPRVAGECDISIMAVATVTDVTSAKVGFRREIKRTKPNATCGALTTLVNNSCYVAKGSWPVDAPLPAIPACP